jgi:hypothetical protein
VSAAAEDCRNSRRVAIVSPSRAESTLDYNWAQSVSDQ